jgi:hypothetical protein
MYWVYTVLDVDECQAAVKTEWDFGVYESTVNFSSR